MNEKPESAAPIPRRSFLEAETLMVFGGGFVGSGLVGCGGSDDPPAVATIASLPMLSPVVGPGNPTAADMDPVSQAP